MKSIAVNISGKSYNILIGNEVSSEIENISKLFSHDKFAVIISEKIQNLHGTILRKLFTNYENCDFIIMQDSEENKNYKYAESFFNEMLKKGYTRKSAVIGIGGGVVGDFAGFIASLYMRGIPVIQIPTTLLAMVDSSIGGKTAVNISMGKNIVGAFHQPKLVISDVSFIKTLPDSELKNGLTEVLKHGIIGEEKLFEIVSENNLKSIRKPDILEEVVYLSAKFKSKIVEEDEAETGLRAILNFGHTAGHAIESLFEFKGISHGEAVAIGLKIEVEISRRLGLLPAGEFEIINNIINKYKLVNNNYNLNADDIIDHMKYDKKNFFGKQRFVLLKNLFHPVYNQEVENSLLKEAITKVINF